MIYILNGVKVIINLKYTKVAKNNNSKHIKSASGFKVTGSDESKRIYEILNNDLGDYLNVQLLNDFNYIILMTEKHLKIYIDF